MRRDTMLGELKYKQALAQNMYDQLGSEARRHLDHIQTQRVMWEAVIALSRMPDAFGKKRARRFLELMGEVAEEIDRMKEDGGEGYAFEKVRQRVEQITGMKIEGLYEDEIARLRSMKL